MTHRNVILFGCGKIGQQALSLLGRENVAYFADNYVSAGESRCGVKVVSTEELVSLAEEYTIIISVGVKYIEAVIEKLKSVSVERFLLFEEVMDAVHSEERLDVQRAGMTEDLLTELQSIAVSVKKIHSLKQDINSEVEFYLVDSFEISHFFPLYRELLHRGVCARFVAEPCFLNPVGTWFDYEKAIQVFNHMGIEYMTISNPTAKVAFTTQYAHDLRRYHNLRCQMFYGVNFLRRKIFQHEETVAREFDFIFTHGEFNSKIFETIIGPGHTVDMSFPRYLEFFQSKPQKEKLLQELGICTKKPILLYYPTWDEYSSISDYAKMIGSLHDDFYTVVKPHHCTYRLPEKADDMKQLNENFDCVLTGTFELWKTTAIADIAICDAGSGVLSEIVFLNPGLKLMTIYKNNCADDFYIDLSKLAVPVDYPNKFLSLFHQLWKADLCMKSRREFIDRIYSPDIATGLQRAADAVQSMLKRQAGGGRK